MKAADVMTPDPVCISPDASIIEAIRLELYDHAVDSNFIPSGHTLKHLFGPAACFAVLRYSRTRQPIA